MSRRQSRAARERDHKRREYMTYLEGRVLYLAAEAGWRERDARRKKQEEVQQD